MEGRRVLFLASGFPPSQRYILRTAKAVEHIQAYGYEPVVLTARGGESPAAASRLPTSVPAVYHAWRLPSPSVVARMGSRLSTPDHDRRLSVAAHDERSLVSRLARGLLLWGDTPDDMVGWLPFALLQGRRLVATVRPLAIHASGPPFSVVLAGALLARFAGLPFVSDFRDAWTVDPEDPTRIVRGAFEGPLLPSRQRVLRLLERRCLRQSAAAVFTSQATLAEYSRTFPELSSRFHLIYNGADPGDFLGTVESSPTPLVSHVGTLHDFQWDQVARLLQALRTALRPGRVPSETRLEFVGSIGVRLRQRLTALTSSLKLDRHVCVRSFVPHQEAVALMRRSHLLLLFGGENRFVRLSKTSEYLAAGPPILALAAAGSETEKEVLRHGGTVLDGSSVEEIGAAVSRLLAEFRSGVRGLRPLEISHPHELNRQTEAQDLARILDAITHRDRE